MTVNIDITELVRTLTNAVQYTEGFLTEVQRQRISFNKRIGDYLVTLLGQYIDSQARVSPETLHHVYEWGAVGNPDARLFQFTMVPSVSHITVNGTLLDSSSVGPTATEPFTDKARIMERGITVVIEPRDAEALVFEDNGETVFVSTSVTVENPGGTEVVGSFANAVHSFFTGYVTREILQPIFNDMRYAREFKQLFAEGTRSGRRVGQKAGRRYMNRGPDGRFI